DEREGEALHPVAEQLEVGALGGIEMPIEVDVAVDIGREESTEGLLRVDEVLLVAPQRVVTVQADDRHCHPGQGTGAVRRLASRATRPRGAHMPYAEGRTFFDADSHLMELPGFLRDHADPSIRERLPQLNFA